MYRLPHPSSFGICYLEETALTTHVTIFFSPEMMLVLQARALPLLLLLHPFRKGFLTLFLISVFWLIDDFRSRAVELQLNSAQSFTERREPILLSIFWIDIFLSRCIRS